VQTVYLNGSISQFGEKWNTKCSDIASIFRLIECQTPGFKNYILAAADSNVGFEIKRGSEFLENPEELLLSLNDEDIIITEIPSGSKSAGQKILAAIAIAIVTFYTAGALTNAAALTAFASGGTATGSGYLAAAAAVSKIGYTLAINLGIQGVTQLLAPGPETEDNTAESYLFDGPTNTINQGIPVPILYGELVVGGAPISTYYSPNVLYPFAEVEIGSGSATGDRTSTFTSTGTSYQETQLLQLFLSKEEIDELNGQYTG
jgi:predicted phage tail protein